MTLLGKKHINALALLSMCATGAVYAMEIKTELAQFNIIPMEDENSVFVKYEAMCQTAREEYPWGYTVSAKEITEQPKEKRRTHFSALCERKPLVAVDAENNIIGSILVSSTKRNAAHETVFARKYYEPQPSKEEKIGELYIASILRKDVEKALIKHAVQQVLASQLYTKLRALEPLSSVRIQILEACGFLRKSTTELPTLRSNGEEGLPIVCIGLEKQLFFEAHLEHTGHNGYREAYWVTE